uniref:Metalloendopeptidase n=1 Tax=Colubraria reticulata TaxID=604273 RepID=A0A330LA05_9CAEN|nr:Meprins-like metalloprotease MD4 [Colubraria reticulata]
MMKVCAALLLLCLGLVSARPNSMHGGKIRNVKYVVHSENTPGYQGGDIMFPKARNAIVGTRKLWSSGIVPYIISPAYPKSYLELIIDTMREMESNTKHNNQYCIRFVEKTTEKDYIVIRPQTGCRSYVGRVGGSQEVSLAQGCLHKGIIMHELLHALGFWHEQNRIDRDQYVTVHIDNIAPDDQGDFVKRNDTDSQTLDTPYDYKSVMHYGPYTFAIDESSPVLTPSKTVKGKMGQRLAMSTNDVLRVQRLYNCPEDTSHITRPSRENDIINCNFDASLCGLTPHDGGDFEWIRKKGETFSATGPNADHTNGAGYYMYAKTNGCGHQIARLRTQNVRGGIYCFDFWIFKQKSVENTFEILLDFGGGWEVSGSTTPSWTPVGMSLNINADFFYFILQANITYSADIAIDDFIFHEGGCE